MKFVHLNMPDLAGVSSPPICANHSATGAYEVKKNPSCCVQSVLVFVFRPIANKNTVRTTNGFSHFFCVSWQISQCTSSCVQCRHTGSVTVLVARYSRYLSIMFTCSDWIRTSHVITICTIFVLWQLNKKPHSSVSSARVGKCLVALESA